MLPEVIAVVHEIIEILAGLRAIDQDKQAELHTALDQTQLMAEGAVAVPEPEPAAEETGEANMTSPPDDREPEASPTS
jgi:hypothetical protein